MFKHETIPVTNQRTVNSTSNFSGFHLSYNPSAADYGSDTTAIVLKNQLFLILNGNHKKSLSEVANSAGLQGCIDYFISNIAQANPIGEHIGAINGKDPFGLAKIRLDLLGQPNIDRIVQAVQALAPKLEDAVPSSVSVRSNKM